MTQQQLVEEFKSYPKASQFEIIREFTKLYEEDLIKHLRNGHKLSIDDEETISLLRETVAIDLKTRLTENL